MAVAEKLNISIGKVRCCLEKNNIVLRNMSEAGFLAHQRRFNKFSCKIKKDLIKKERELMIAGVMLYWAEGWKKDSTSVAFSNSDPEMIKLFLKFLREICNVYENRIRLPLHFYEDQDEKGLKVFWSKVTDIPLERFSKSYMHKSKGGSYKKKSKYGTVSLRYNDKKLLKEILQQIDNLLLSL